MSDKPLESLGELIKSLREKNRLTQATLGKQLGVSGAAVSSWEKNDKLPEPERFIALFSMWGMDPLGVVAHYDCDIYFVERLKQLLIKDYSHRKNRTSSHDEIISWLIEDGEVVMRRMGAVDVARTMAAQAITLILETGKGNLDNLSLREKARLHKACDLYLDAVTRLGNAKYYHEAHSYISYMFSVATTLTKQTEEDEWLAIPEYRLADLYGLEGEYKRSRDTVEQCLKREAHTHTRGEVLRVKLRVLRYEGDKERLYNEMKKAQEQWALLDYYSHERGCLGESIALSASQINPQSGYGAELIKTIHEWYKYVSSKGFGDHLVNTLILTRRAKILLDRGLETDIENIRNFASEALVMSEGTYLGLLKENQTLIEKIA